MQRLEVTARGGVPPPRPKWITEVMWNQCQHIESAFDNFETLTLTIVNNHAQWIAFYKSDDPYHYIHNKYVPDPKTAGTE